MSVYGAPPLSAAHAQLIQVQSKEAQQQAEERFHLEAVAMQKGDAAAVAALTATQHAHPPGMLAEEPSPAPKRPTGLVIQTQPHGSLLLHQAHQSHVTLTPQQMIAKNQAMLAHHHGVAQEQSLSASYYSEDDAEAESSDDESPRENRVLTFADEHGKNLVAVHWYEPDPGEDNRATIGGGGSASLSGEEIVDQGCGAKCVIL